MKKAILATLLGATLLGSPAYAAVQQAPGRGGPMMQADANHDGILTRQEALAAADARFAKLDTNKDGQLSREEHRATKRHHGGTYKRGGADDAKRAGFHQRMLDRFDADKDGTLSDAERQAARQVWQAKRSAGGSPDGRGMKPRADTDGNGSVSLAEARTIATARFDRIDSNHDGRIDKAEREAAHAKHKAMRGHGRHHGVPAPAPR
ncbi:EF-hand domain-containing protein [Sphingomonas sp. S2-65]|uniref:EF-hand domain-containing protein n=1 Tax=Sphingomonas sp. S2-65 TaxID=2903960 RepID=UPI001F275D5E|nr:EF-hand domain-containing protein [Sphingomonas sp. S2-65]UYY58850.1 hypothetical protein LZ586_01695 [Sphingomonas sp. S2-65]